MTDTTVAIWEHYYLASVPHHLARSVQDIEIFGVPLSGIQEVDQEIMGDEVERWCTINDMIELYRQGIYIRLCNRGDSAKIYDAISSHIAAWKTRLEYGVHNAQAPLEDLLVMDEFASVVYDNAVRHFDDPKKLDPYRTALAKNSLFSAQILATPGPKNKTVVEETQYASSEEFFLERLRARHT